MKTATGRIEVEKFPKKEANSPLRKFADSSVSLGNYYSLTRDGTYITKDALNHVFIHVDFIIVTSVVCVGGWVDSEGYA